MMPLGCRYPSILIISKYPLLSCLYVEFLNYLGVHPPNSGVSLTCVLGVKLRTHLLRQVEPKASVCLADMKGGLTEVTHSQAFAGGAIFLWRLYGSYFLAFFVFVLRL